jgi:hypothetical protein
MRPKYITEEMDQAGNGTGYAAGAVLVRQPHFIS